MDIVTESLPTAGAMVVAVVFLSASVSKVRRRDFYAWLSSSRIPYPRLMNAAIIVVEASIGLGLFLPTSVSRGAALAAGACLITFPLIAAHSRIGSLSPNADASCGCGGVLIPASSAVHLVVRNGPLVGLALLQALAPSPESPTLSSELASVALAVCVLSALLLANASLALLFRRRDLSAEVG